ncbi:MAG: NAD(P)-binding protein, partial [Acidobacteria bacterium]|nr:NAD(P)-binding protein [Acidobacteriota bacterium]
MAIDCDVVVVGAGAAGLAACAELRRQRPALRVICLEASSRIGGRIYTRRDPASLLPVELGAEFVHGRPPELFRMPELLLYEHTGEALYVRNGKLFANDEALFEASER